MTASAPHLPQRVAGRYDVIQPLGRGAFGRTVLARDTRLDRLVAIKALARPDDLKALELFEREAAVLPTLRHAGVPEVYELLRDRWDGVPTALLVMEYVEGRSLAEVIQAGDRLGQADVLHLMVELLSVLEYLHGRVPPVLHRDIKPGNVILRQDGSVALVDFGAVRAVHRDAADPGSTVVGTYGYMPYEQYMGQASPASDLYALGATFLHLVTGRAPREFMNEAGRLEVPAELPVGEPLRGVLSRLLAPSPADRFQSARATRGALFAIPAAPGAVAAARSGTTGLAVSGNAAQLLAQLPPAPRPLDGDLKKLARRIAGSSLELMDSGTAPAGGVSLGGMAVVGFFSVLTVGILPLLFRSLSVSRRRRVLPFLRDGSPATGVVLGMEPVDTGFGQKLTQVRYEFGADGQIHRGADKVMPWITQRWHVGDRVPVLYVAERDYDSIIVSTT